MLKYISDYISYIGFKFECLNAYSHYKTHHCPKTSNGYSLSKNGIATVGSTL